MGTHGTHGNTWDTWGTWEHMRYMGTHGNIWDTWEHMGHMGYMGTYGTHGNIWDTWEHISQNVPKGPETGDKPREMELTLEVEMGSTAYSTEHCGAVELQTYM
jgi:hypothetical protein